MVRTGLFQGPNTGSIPVGVSASKNAQCWAFLLALTAGGMFCQKTKHRGGVAKIASDGEQLFVTMIK